MKPALTAVLLAAVVLTAAGCGSSRPISAGPHHISVSSPLVHLGPVSAPQKTSTCRSRCIWARQGRLDSLAGYATRVAGAVHVFAGVRIDDQANEVILYLVHAPQSVIDRIVKTHRPHTFVIHNNAPRTWRQVVALQKSINWTAWKAKGVNIASTAPTGTGYLEVGVMSSIKKAQALFDAAYPNGVIRVVRGERSFPAAATGRT